MAFTRFLELSSLFSSEPNSSVELHSCLPFHCCVLNGVSFVHPQIFVSSFLFHFFDGGRVVDMDIASAGKAPSFEGGFSTLLKAKLHLNVTAECLHAGEETLLLAIIIHIEHCRHCRCESYSLGVLPRSLHNNSITELVRVACVAAGPRTRQNYLYSPSAN